MAFKWILNKNIIIVFAQNINPESVIVTNNSIKADGIDVFFFSFLFSFLFSLRFLSIFYYNRFWTFDYFNSYV